MDSSSLAKRYIAETGSEFVRTLCEDTEQYQIVIASITPVEITSAVMRRYREGNFDDNSLEIVLSLIDNHILHEYKVVDLSATIIKHAKELLRKYSLRAYDSIQLASCLQLVEKYDDKELPPTFCCADIRLYDIAKAESLKIINPNNPQTPS